jgi:hypothetical protein
VKKIHHDEGQNVLSIEKCNKILNKKSERKYSNEEVKIVRTFLTAIAKIQVEQLLKNKG